MYPAGRAGGDRAPNPGGKGRFEKAGEAISFGIFLFFFRAGKVSPPGFLSPRENLLARAKGRIS